jgi:hypothetical protein
MSVEDNLPALNRRAQIDQKMGDIASDMYGSLEEGDFPLNLVDGSGNNKAVVISFRISPWMDDMAKAIQEDMLLPNKSEVFRTFVWMGVRAWYSLSKSRNNKLKTAMDAERLRAIRLRDEYARYEVLAQIKELENLCRAYKKEGEYEYIVALLNEYVSLVDQEKNDILRKRYMKILANHVEIPDIVREARLRLGYKHTQRIEEFLKRVDESQD